ncbi:S9 family peptidase [Paraglaciecola hydrolytica]|uniref:Peptidase S9 n=1 Tax=Paraglaciecola hydrolytica TaxID=1799789 RepID=A0A136A175_9ALTE|nr:S9 family peptidase [Paraglaciecola hydrolytica]KXI28988.1 peptidase S9 [Paraglaciecola hydrolytica]
MVSKLKTLSFISILLLLLQSCSPATKQTESASADLMQKPAFQTYSAEEFYKTTSVFGSSINHDGTLVLVSNDASGIFNAYQIPLDGSAPTQLSHSTQESIYVDSWFPVDNRFLYTADQGGNELDHLYVQEPDGKVTDLTPGENLKANFVGWHEDDKHFYVVSNERNPQFFDLYIYATEDYSRKLIYENVDGLALESVSPNGNWVVGSKVNSNADSDLYLIDLKNTALNPMLLTAHQGDITYSAFTFSQDSQKLIYATDEYGEFVQAWQYDLTNKEHQAVLRADWDVSFVYFSKDGKYRISGINADAQTKLSIVDTQTGKNIALPKMPDGDLRGVNFSKDSSTMVFYLNSDTSPSNLYVYQVGGDSVTRLTNTGNPNINESDLVTGEVVRFDSFDGLSIPGILYKPQQAVDKKVPALVWIHGGPGGQSRKGYSALIQHLVNNGYAILQINNRGSSGYGKTFFHLDDKRHGQDDLQDVVYCKQYLQSLPWVESENIGVIGGSYGGYLTMAAMTFTKEFKVGINIFGVTNWVRTLKSIPPYWESFRKSLYDELGDPETDEERLHSISPVFFGHKVTSPVLVVQGANDPRVLKIESDEMVEAIRSSGTYVDYLVFDDEGHGFSKKDNRIAASNKFVSFLDSYLK